MSISHTQEKKPEIETNKKEKKPSSYGKSSIQEIPVNKTQKQKEQLSPWV